MNNEVDILNNIQQNNEATQRDIAKYTGLSLGSVNLLIKRLVSKGMVKIERLNARTIRYVLTPIGMREKAEATYRYIIDSYKLVNNIDIQIDEILENVKSEKDFKFILFGGNDEVIHFIQHKVNQKNLQVVCTADIKNLKDMVEAESKKCIVISWKPENIDLLTSNNVKHINLLDRL